MQVQELVAQGSWEPLYTWAYRPAMAPEKLAEVLHLPVLEAQAAREVVLRWLAVLARASGQPLHSVQPDSPPEQEEVELEELDAETVPSSQ